MTIVRTALLVLAAAALGACERLDQHAMLLVLDPAYKAETLLDSRDGIASPDGLRWEKGSLYIADEGASALLVLDAQGKLTTLATAKDGLKSPEDLARGPDGALYWTDDDAGGLWRHGASGDTSLRLSPKGALAGSEGLSVAPSGVILIGGGTTGQITLLAPDGRVRALPIRMAKPESMAFDGAGNLYIGDNEEDVLYLLTNDGYLHRPIANREGFSPETLHFADGALFITDSRHGKLHRYTPQDGLATTAVLAGELANVQGITSDPSGNLYLSVQIDLKGRRGTVLRLTRLAQK